MPSIQQSAALALGRLANYSDDLAEAVVGNEILPQLVYSLSEQNRWVLGTVSNDSVVVLIGTLTRKNALKPPETVGASHMETHTRTHIHIPTYLEHKSGAPPRDPTSGKL